MIDWAATEQAVRDLMEWLESADYCEDRLDCYATPIMEEAVKAVFGSDVFKKRINPIMCGPGA